MADDNIHVKQHNPVFTQRATMALQSLQQKLASLRYTNTLHGFQSVDEGKNLALAWISETIDASKVVSRIKARTQSATVFFDDWIGHNYMGIALTERHLIPVVLNTLLDELRLVKMDPPPPTPPGCLYPYQGSYAEPTLSGSCIFNIVVDHRHVWGLKPPVTGFTLMTRLQPYYESGDTVSVEASEAKYLNQVTREDAMLPTGFYDRFVEWYHVQPWAWRTPEGKAYAQAQFDADIGWANDDWVTSGTEFEPEGWIGRMIVECGDQDPIIDYPIVDMSRVRVATDEPVEPDVVVATDEPIEPNVVVATDETVEPNVVAATDEPIEPDVVVATDEPTEIPVDSASPDALLCYVCLDAPPETVVLPCGHFVVCNKCSEALKNTADARVCVRCRRPIETILSDAC